MPIYGPGNKTITELIDRLIDDNYPDLVEVKATVGAIFAYPILNQYGVAKGSPVTEYGCGVMAKVKPNGEADRIEGKPDATITIDHDQWKDLPEGPRAALVDRMLYTLVVRRKKGAALTDDRGRPLLKKRKADWLISGFRAMAQRHKADAIEMIQAVQFRNDFGQLLFNFSDMPEPATLPGIEPGKKPRGRRSAAVAAAAGR